MFARVENDKITEYPVDLRKSYPNISWPKDLSTAALPDGIVWVEPTAMPAVEYAEVAEVDPQMTDGKWYQQWGTTPWSDDDTKQAVLAAISAKKFQVETGGVTLPNGMSVRTTIDDQNRISNAVFNGQRLGLTEVSFLQPDNSYATISMDDLVTIADAIGMHVQACFDAGKAHYTAVNAIKDSVSQTAYQQLVAYDITTGWPANGGSA
ncbi:DUF4376 domain-containing protein [Candidimonas nitroreducens]|uniref:DUF4376 domain-containing protein n=1 Tax=Candidimonas nitroreducens TaxID=683354 RepID=A0A225M1Q3_9BURK|nr:DUF4376 domain-containing protein [Candidimonas nitroreducens]OWT55274.1 hypothetical protein CEY11_21430 [Candidimonas nitroreducens]